MAAHPLGQDRFGPASMRAKVALPSQVYPRRRPYPRRGLGLHARPPCLPIPLFTPRARPRALMPPPGLSTPPLLRVTACLRRVVRALSASEFRFSESVCWCFTLTVAVTFGVTVIVTVAVTVTDRRCDRHRHQRRDHGRDRRRDRRCDHHGGMPSPVWSRKLGLGQVMSADHRTRLGRWFGTSTGRASGAGAVVRGAMVL